MAQRQAMYEANHEKVAERSNKQPPSKDSTLSGQRMSAIESMQATVIENHGFEMKQYTKEALTNNTKIINTPVMQRGGLLDVLI